MKKQKIQFENSVFSETEFGYLNPYIICEIGVNHEGSIDTAKRMIDEIADNGGHAAKFQSYKAETLAAKKYSQAYWDTNKEPTKSQFELFKKHDKMSPKDYEKLSNYCAKKKVDFLSTPFDLEAVDYLSDMCPIFKIASADITNVPLMRKIAQKNKPVVLSTGASHNYEIQQAIDVISSENDQALILLHCILLYPTPYDEAKLSKMEKLWDLFVDQNCLVGYSDHVPPDAETNDDHAIDIATLMGACVVEKHYTHDRTLKGNDHYHAFDRYGLLNYVKKVEKYRQLIGNSHNDVASSQKKRKRKCPPQDFHYHST